MRVAIVGAGVSGIAMAYELHRSGIDFTVFERSAGPGGTWFDNTFPGCEVDVEAHGYAFPFMPHDWARSYPAQAEILSYLNYTIDHFSLSRYFRYNTAVESVTWIDERNLYEVRTAGGEQSEYDVVVSCLGLLNNPKLPTWPGLEDFAGPKFHTARWDHSVALPGQRVAVVGTGSTASQLVPALAELGAEVILFQRTPGWVLPKGERDYTDRERARWVRHQSLQRLARYRHVRVRSSRKRYRGLRMAETKQQQVLRQSAVRYIESQVKDPEVRAQVTPPFPIGCKRIILASTFYAALNRPEVTLIPHAVERVTPAGVVDATGQHHDIDILVMATGFTAQQYLATLRVYGQGGRSLHEAWGKSARAYFGTTVPGFPNFFMLYGPTTNGPVSQTLTSARQARAVARTLRAMRRRRAQAVDTRPAAYDWFVRWMDAGNAKLTSNHPRFCRNYYYAEDGRNVTQFPFREPMHKFIWNTSFGLGLTFRASPPGRRRASPRQPTAAAAE